MSLKFTPPKKIARYALFVDHGDGRGFFKSYNDLGSAKNSYHAHGHRYDSKILESVEGEWFVLFDIQKGTEYAKLPWVIETRRNSWGSNSYTYKKAKPMTRDEYANWRLAVERERTAF